MQAIGKKGPVARVPESAQRHGSKAMLLNTQFDNDSAIALYESEGYVKLPETLAVLRAG